MKRDISALAALLLHSFVSAFHSSNQYPTEAALGYAPPDGTTTFLDASNNPNVSNSVAFVHFNGSDTTSNDVIAQNWTWTVKVSDVFMPNASTTNDSNLPVVPNAHVAYTTYDFSWPEPGGLNNAISTEANATGAPIQSCAWIISGLFPQKVSKSWDSSSSNCISALGAGCVQGLQNLISTASGTSCESQSVNLLDPDFTKACASSLNAIHSTEEGEAFWPRNFGNATASNAASLQKGEVFSYSLSPPYTPSNMSIFDSEADNLHVLALTGNTVNVLCNRGSGGGEVAATGSASSQTNVHMTIIGIVAVTAGMLGSW
ncbi:hypothetical protein K431DRAFT_344723 [Polychaeton citri CBS 116435]|uniref:Uncharacterized protein n=1 Tax=Polychaeton citri CBS 116435 TaxID=1314669 RepID=A0A9P4QEL8_9PEZI|nr:hypothetical protein K431DRAFT_344723 [Polychaeton citri CBS 116435]